MKNIYEVYTLLNESFLHLTGTENNIRKKVDDYFNKNIADLKIDYASFLFKLPNIEMYSVKSLAKSFNDNKIILYYEPEYYQKIRKEANDDGVFINNANVDFLHKIKMIRKQTESDAFLFFSLNGAIAGNNNYSELLDKFQYSINFRWYTKFKKDVSFSVNVENGRIVLYDGNSNYKTMDIKGENYIPFYKSIEYLSKHWTDLNDEINRRVVASNYEKSRLILKEILEDFLNRNEK